MNVVLVLLLSHVCAAELGLPDDSPTAECLGQLHVQQGKADRKDVTLERQVIAFHSIFKKKRNGRWLVDGSRQKWVRALRLGDAESAEWSRYAKRRWVCKTPSDGCRSARKTWLAYQEVAAAFLAGETLHPFPKADDYGGDCDDVRGACDPPKSCQRRVRTSIDTHQAFWNSDACVAGRRRKVIPAGVAAGVPAHVVAER